MKLIIRIFKSVINAFTRWFSRLFDSNEKQLKQLQPLVDRINGLEPEFKKLSDEELKAKTEEFKSRLKEGSSLDDILPEAFAAVREAAIRTLGQRHFDVQIMGGIVLHQGRIAEMRTGEGKTLVATLPLYLNALTGKGCHLVTVNDYLSKRDPHWMGPVFDALGISVASIQHQESFIFDTSYETEDGKWNYMRPVTRLEAYEADITYGTNNEFGFDYLRDNMVIELSRCSQRPLNYAIVDEVDNILIDEARTPLIISGPAEEAEQKYHIFARLVPNLHLDDDYTVDEKHRGVSLTDSGINKIEGWLNREGVLNASNLYDPSNASLTRYMDNALKAQVLYKKDRDYVVKNGEVVIVDEFTGRLMTGRRYSAGLHQSIEAKERVKVQRESMTFATITFQNYFRMYEKLAGMTGTAVTEAEEFHKIYSLDVVVIPTDKTMIRKDNVDQIYKDELSKFKAVVREVEARHKEKRPILIGTVSIEKSEELSGMLKRKGVKHQVLNAKQHESEAAIIAEAGRLNAVTVATNMAGRGVDIVLGGSKENRDPEEWQKEHDEVIEQGGLHIIGTERHEARRIDNQLRGRAGRQGDPGSSLFYVSLEDDIMRRFGGDRVKTFMEWAGMGEDTPIENKIVNRSIESAQMRVEGYHFDIRKHLVDYDDVVNTQREVIYNQRREILNGVNLKETILSMVEKEVTGLIEMHYDNGYSSEEAANFLNEINTIMPLPDGFTPEKLGEFGTAQIKEQLIQHYTALYEQKENEHGNEQMRLLERLIMLRIIDNYWVEHLTEMDYMRTGIGLQAVAQRDPLVAYKREAHGMFESLMESIQHDIVHTIFHVNLSKQPVARRAPSRMEAVAAASGGGNGKKRPRKMSGKKIGRNDPCPCGSGKKYKHCCGK